MEAALTPLMERIEKMHPQVRVFSLPSVDHPQYGRHIELGVKGPAPLVPAAWQELKKVCTILVQIAALNWCATCDAQA